MHMTFYQCFSKAVSRHPQSFLKENREYFFSDESPHTIVIKGTRL